MRALILIAGLVIAGLVVAGCATSGATAPEDVPEAERVGMMQRLGTTLRSACGEDNDCTAMAGRFAGFLWEYRESFSVQARVYRCVGQYAVQQGYGWGARRFVDQIEGEEQATGMVTYLYQCAVPSWARSWFDDGGAGEPPVPPGEIRTGPASYVTASGLDMQSTDNAARLLRPNEANAAATP